MREPNVDPKKAAYYHTISDRIRFATRLAVHSLQHLNDALHDLVIGTGLWQRNDSRSTSHLEPLPTISNFDTRERGQGELLRPVGAVLLVHTARLEALESTMPDDTVVAVGGFEAELEG